MRQILPVVGLVLLAGSVSPSVQAQSEVAAQASKPPENPGAPCAQHFYCNAGFALAVCQEHVAKLKEVLKQLPATAPTGWRWVIVRSQDWGPLVISLHLDHRAVVFSSLGLRSTFLEEALFLSSPKRAHELVRDFHAPLDKLLWVAVSHELAHAICHEQNEAAANLIAEELRNGTTPECPITGASTNPIKELPYHRLHSQSRNGGKKFPY